MVSIDDGAPADVRSSLLESASRGAERAAELARELGLDAEPLVVDARVVAIGAHNPGPILGSVSRGVVRNAPCPALVVREM